jgi:NADPH-dependent glutamate synthase beta subunit-like oxidoreductase
MLRHGLGDFDLPLEDLERDIERIMSLGVTFRTGVEIGSVAALEGESADAVLIATGAPAPGAVFEHAMAGVEGVEHAAAFAGSVRQGRLRSLPHHVVVEGHGPWAVTAARMALRLGAVKVSLVVPAELREDELETGPFAEAAAEGAEVLSPVRVTGLVQRGGRLAAVECARLGFGRRDIRGRALDERQAGTLRIRASRFIEAMDRRPGVDWLFERGGVRPGLQGAVAVDGATLMTGRKNLFAAGDVVTGPRSVLSAVAMGVRAAREISRALKKGGR